MKMTKEMIKDLIETDADMQTILFAVNKYARENQKDAVNARKEKLMERVNEIKQLNAAVLKAGMGHAIKFEGVHDALEIMEEEIERIMV